MTIFNIRVCQNNNDILIKSVQLNMNHVDSWKNDVNTMQLVMDYDEEMTNEGEAEYQPLTILRLMKVKFNYPDPSVADRAVDRQEDRKYSYGVADGHTTYLMEANPSSYTLPTNPSLALDLLAAYASFADQKQFTHIQFVHDDLEKKISRTDKRPNRRVTQKQLLNLGKPAADTESMLKILMESILNLEPRPEEYKAAISAITKIYKYSLAHPDIPLSRCLEGRLRTSILLDVPIESLYFTAAQTPDTRMREMYSIARKLIADNLGTELNRFIDETNLDVKKNIFRPRFENGSPLDGLNLDWDDFYSKVFSSATFNIRSDGRMSFNIDTNPCYLATYKDGDPSSTLLKIDFHLLAERLGMEFDKDSNYLGEIIFSAESSQKLISAGLHYNLDYVKKIIRERWTASLFAQAKRNPANEKQEPCPMQTLPRDICNLIADFTYADKEQGLLPAEKQAIRTLGQQDNPMTGLNMLFFKPAVQEEVILDKTPKNKCVIC